MKCIHSNCSDKNLLCSVKLQHKHFNCDEIDEVAKLYNLKLKTIHSEVNIEGSPERTDFRTVFEDETGSYYIIERLAHHTFNTKKRITLTLDFLRSQGMKKIQPYIFSPNNEHIVRYQDCFWQIVPYVEGIELQRPEYVYDRWRGGVFADFLIALNTYSQEIPYFEKTDNFSLPNYIEELMEAIKQNKPELVSKFLPVLKFLEISGYMKNYQDFPISFCHGDFHPINMVWGKSDINVVIDWEFTGYKPEIYDVANMIGCIGIEDPNSLTGELVVEFIKELKNANIISDLSWNYLLESIIAQRFAWLSEWLRKNDLEMQEMEEDYLTLLIEKQDILRNCWNSLIPSEEPCIYV